MNSIDNARGRFELKNLAGHRFYRLQKRHETGDIINSVKFAEHVFLFSELNHFRCEIAGHFSFQKTGQHAIHANTALPAFISQRMGQTNETGFGRSVIDLACRRANSGERANIYDVAETLFQHDAKRGFGASESTFEVGVEHAIPFGFRHF